MGIGLWLGDWSLSFQDGEVSGIAAEGVWMECPTCAFFSMVVLVPFLPQLCFLPHSLMELLVISAPYGKSFLVLKVLGRSGSYL